MQDLTLSGYVHCYLVIQNQCNYGYNKDNNKNQYNYGYNKDNNKNQYNYGYNKDNNKKFD